jgi:hypothetical protein
MKYITINYKHIFILSLLIISSCIDKKPNKYDLIGNYRERVIENKNYNKFLGANKSEVRLLDDDLISF